MISRTSNTRNRIPNALYAFFFFNDTATTEIYTLSLHDALPICRAAGRQVAPGVAPRHQRPRRGEGAAEPHLGDHPGRPARCVDVEGAAYPVRADAHRSPSASGGEGGARADPHHAPDGRVHIPLALHRDPRPCRALRDEVLRFVLERSAAPSRSGTARAARSSRRAARSRTAS